MDAFQNYMCESLQGNSHINQLSCFYNKMPDKGKLKERKLYSGSQFKDATDHIACEAK